MPVIINTNTAATSAASSLGTTNTKLQKSLSRLSSGNRIVSSAEDAGGLAVSMKLTAAIKRTDATSSNVSNAQSFLQTMDGGLQTAGNILGRMSELTTLAQDVTKSTSDVSAYALEFTSLQTALTDLAGSKFNGVNLFDGSSLTVATSEDGAQNVSITAADLTADAGVTAVTGAATLTAATAAANAALVTTAIQNVATMRAQNGADSSALSFAADTLSVNKTNLEAANSRIADVDVAQESTKLARYNILQQAGTAMLAQANQSTQSILRLLQ
jgi:flagellin